MPDPYPLSVLAGFGDGLLHREEMAQEETSGYELLKNNKFIKIQLFFKDKNYVDFYG